MAYFAALQQITEQMRGNLTFCSNRRQVESSSFNCNNINNCLQDFSSQNCSSGEKLSLLSKCFYTDMESKGSLELSQHIAIYIMGDKLLFNSGEKFQHEFIT